MAAMPQRALLVALVSLLVLTLDGATPAAASVPTATTEAATELEPESATLNATVNPGGEDTTYRFEYGTDTSYGTDVPVPDKGIGSGEAALEVSQAVEGLQPGTTYHFRVIAENVEGEAVGEDLSFTAPPDCQNLESAIPTGEPLSLSLECGAGELTYELTSEPAHGLISDFAAGVGALTYTSEEEFTGVDSFNFRSSGPGGESNIATVTVNVCSPPEIEAAGDVKEPKTPGVNLQVSAATTATYCHVGEEEGQIAALRIYIDEELVEAEEPNCDDPEDPCGEWIERGFQLPYAKVIGTHTYEVQVEDQFGYQAEPVEWSETTPEEGTIARVPDEAEDSNGPSGCATPKNRFKKTEHPHYVFRGNVVYGTKCADILGTYPGHHTRTYVAGAGDDLIRAGGEINRIRGGAGNDRIYAGRGNDMVFGQAGDDQVNGGSGDDVIEGNSGDDILAGSAGADEVLGGGDSDLLMGGTTSDRLEGGSGSDTLSFADAVTPGFEFGEFLNGFPPSNFERGVYIDLGETPIEDSHKRQYIRAFDGYTARFGGGSDRIYVDKGSFQNVIGSPYADVIIGSSEANLIDGGGGPDIIEGGGGDDEMYGGADSDLLDGGADQSSGNLHGGTVTTSVSAGPNRRNRASAKAPKKA